MILNALAALAVIISLLSLSCVGLALVSIGLAFIGELIEPRDKHQSNKGKHS